MNPGLLNHIVEQNRKHGSPGFGNDLGRVGLWICFVALGASILGVIGLLAYVLFLNFWN